jgi:RimJ/RimL family protein N-acetyltransferase
VIASAALAPLTFRPLTRADLPMLHGWLQRPHVAEWWHEPTTLAELDTDYFSADALASSTRPFIALLGAEPIGFIQSYVALGSGAGWWEDETDPGTRGIDQFLADEARLGRGIGSAMVDAFAKRLFADPTVTKIQTDPSARQRTSDPLLPARLLCRPGRDRHARRPRAADDPGSALATDSARPSWHPVMP